MLSSVIRFDNRSFQPYTEASSKPMRSQFDWTAAGGVLDQCARMKSARCTLSGIQDPQAGSSQNSPVISQRPLYHSFVGVWCKLAFVVWGNQSIPESWLGVWEELCHQERTSTRPKVTGVRLRPEWGIFNSIDSGFRCREEAWPKLLPRCVRPRVQQKSSKRQSSAWKRAVSVTPPS